MPPVRISKPDPTSWDTYRIDHLLPEGGGLCLDLGCGPGARQAFQDSGYRYIGTDLLKTDGADVASDASALPFDSCRFDLVIAASSFEHFPAPWEAAREIFRILRPGGYFIGSMAFLEPYHANSCFHMSHRGAEHLFRKAGFQIETIEPFERSGPEVLAHSIYQSRLAGRLTGLIFRSSMFLRRVGILLMIKIMRNSARKDRARQFLSEERYRFTAGIKIRARRPEC